MNTIQRKILFATAGLLIVMLLFPPFTQRSGRAGHPINDGYSFIITSSYSQVRTSLLGLQFLIVTTVGGILFFAFKEWESSDDDVEDEDDTQIDVGITVKHCADELVSLANSSTIANKNNRNEIVVFCYWAIAFHLMGSKRQFIEQLDKEIQLRTGISYRDFIERLEAYHNSSTNQTGEEPGYWLAKTFHQFATGEDCQDVDVLVPLSVELAAISQACCDFAHGLDRE